MKRVLSILLVAVLAGAGIAIAAQSGEEDQPNPGTDLTALRCPLEPTGKTIGGEPEYRPAKDSFDTAELIGLDLADAEATAGRKGCEIIVALKDGAGQPVPIERNPTLISVYTENGVVTEIEGVGGGI